MQQVKILNVTVHNVGRDEALRIAEGFIIGRKPCRLVTLNTLMANYAHRDEDFARVVNSADLTIPDGMGIVWGAKFLGSPLRGRVPGIDLMNDLFVLSSQEGYKVYLLGAREGVIQEAVVRLEKLFPSLQIVGWHNGYLDPVQSRRVVGEIRGCSPDILFVGMGAGHQEKWIRDNLNRLGVPLCMGVGGSFDVISARLNRAPIWMRNLGLEWLYRTALEPWRIKNVLSGLPWFIVRVIGQRLWLKKRDGVRWSEGFLP